MVTHPTPVPYSGRAPQREDVPLRFHATTFGKFLEKAREAAGVTREIFIETVNEIITKKNEHLPSKDKIQAMTLRVYGNTERKERYPAFEELEPLYQALSTLLEEPFSMQEREHYIALAQARIGERKKRPKKGYHPTAQDWQSLRKKLTAFDEHYASGRSTQKGNALYLLPFPSEVPPQIRLSQKVISLLKFDTSHVIERDGYVEDMMRLWDQGKRLIVTKALSGTGKTRAFYLLLKHIARMQNHWPFYYALTSSSQTPDDHLDTLLSLLYTDLQLSSPEDERLPREERIERISTELTRCSEHGLRLAVLLDDAHLLLESSSGTLSPSWQHFFDLWIGRSHTAVLCLAAREWPHWRGRDRNFLKEIDLKPLSLEGGAMLWKRAGFDDVADNLLEEASRKCGGYPQWIERRASDLDQPGHLFLWPNTGKGTFANQSADNEHTERIKAWLKEETIFDAITDVDAREELTQVFSRQLLYHTQQVLDLLAASPLGIPFQLLEQKVDHPERAIDELMRCSLIDRSSIEQRRVALVPLAREARLHQLSKEQREQIEQRVTELYTCWLYDIQQYQDDAEQAALIAELVVLYMKKQQFLTAGELLATYGWLCAQLGHMSRIERYASPVRLFSPSSLEEEDGRALLHYQVMILTGKKADAQARQARQAAYKRIHMAARQGTLRLQPHTETHIAHVLILPLVGTRRYAEAYQSLEEVSDHLSWDVVSPEARAAFLHSKAYVLREWSDSTASQEEAKSLRDECITVLGQAIEYWRSCMEHALPLSERYMKFKLARALNDFAYCARLLGRLREAEEAIKECVDLKKQGATLSSSLGVSLGEQAQILAAQGKFEQSHILNQEALDIMSALIEKGSTSTIDEKGMLLDERAHVYLRQARLQEARPLFEEARDLLKDTLLRQNFRDDAIKQIEWIESVLHTRRLYQLDQHWFEHLREIAFSDDVEMLTQAGPFTREEQQEWNKLFEHRAERGAKLRMKELIAVSQERELAQSLAEQRLPQFQYPFLDPEDISSRITKFQTFLAEIEAQERNAVVCRLYRERITEELYYLRLFEAVSRQDSASVQKWNEVLYGKPSQEEMGIALGEFAKLLSKGRKRPETQSLSEHIRAQLKQWRIHIDDFSAEEQEQKGTRPRTHQQEAGYPSLSASDMQQIIEEVLAEYGFSWDVLPSPERHAPSVDKDRTEISLPTRRRYPLVQVLEFVAEEIEQHVYRSEAGRRSPLALLQSGTKGYLATEEGLGIHYIQKAREAQGFEPKNYSWITTLAPGLAAGVIFPPMNFREVSAFLEQAFLLSHLLSGRHKTFAEARQAATQDTLRRTTRTFRGVPDLDAVGVCSLKDRIYLQGHLAVSRKITTTPVDRLLVGAIGIEQLEDIAELHILEPAMRHRDLASSPEWLSRLIQLAGKERGE